MVISIHSTPAWPSRNMYVPPLSSHVYLLGALVQSARGRDEATCMRLRTDVVLETERMDIGTLNRSPCVQPTCSVINQPDQPRHCEVPDLEGKKSLSRLCRPFYLHALFCLA